MTEIEGESDRAREGRRGRGRDGGREGEKKGVRARQKEEGGREQQPLCTTEALGQGLGSGV